MTSTVRAPRRRRELLLATFAALGSSGASALLPATARAQQNCAPSFVNATRAWPPPLDRKIALRARDVSLREALDRIAAAARFRVSYSAEFLPLDRHVCLFVDSISAGDALGELLSGVDVAPVVTSIDQVVIAPSRSVGRTEQDAVQTLERVVVTGSATGNAQRPLTVALDVIDGKKLNERASSTLSSTFDGNVPGLWVWEQGPSTLLARYGSIRGASSFNVSYPKVYIDGIEVANPLLVTEINPAIVDRVEVIRGPQGAALYGADAISGVVNIVTRHEGLQAGADRTVLASGAGLSQTEYADRAVLAQNHSLIWRAGSNMRSGSLGMNLTTLGGYVPEAYSRDLKLNGGFRLVSSMASVTGTARFYGKQAAIGHNPLIRGFAASAPARIGVSGFRAAAGAAAAADSTAMIVRDSLPQSVREYTVGGTTTFLTGGRWTPSVTAGIDGYRLANVPNDLAPVPSSLDSALHDARGGADRGTFRAAFVGQFDLASSESLTITLGAEHSALRETFRGIAVGAGPGSSRRDLVTWRSNSGLVAQGNLSLRDAFYVTGGFRLERNDGFTLSGKTVVLPMVGLAAVRDVGAVTLKARGAYGVGIRPARTSAREMALHDIRQYAFGAALDPERQSGVELGADVFFGRRLGLHVTRFDQLATGLIQPVATPRDSQPKNTGTGSWTKPRLAYVLQNVGEITNRGWELESSFNLGAMSLGGALSTVDSRVRRIARGYTGDLRVGDRMLAVPAKTASFSIGWDQPRWYASVTASRAFDWINYNRLELAKDYATCTSCTAQDLTGAKLRSYWMPYEGVMRMRATLSRDVLRNVGIKLTADNLTNAQRGEPDNITVLPGRTVLLGLSAKIR